MCYMKVSPKRVGVREMRQNLSVYLRRIARGETLEVTEHGKPVAILAPLPEPIDILDKLEAEGRLTRAKGDLLDLPAPTRPAPPDLWKWFEEQRADRKL
jgi:prevent-host-death family protein